MHEDEELVSLNVDKVMMWIQDPARVGESLVHRRQTDRRHAKWGKIRISIRIP